MKRWLVAAAAVMAVAAFVGVGSASADVPRYQLQHGTIHVLWGGALVHDFVVDLNPCDGTFTGTGDSWQGSLHVLEHVTGTLTADHFSFYSTYDDNMTAYGDYWWAYDGPRTGGIGSSSMGEAFTVNSLQFNLSGYSNYKTHGEYVKAMGGGADAAHACIGIPIQNVAMTFTATVPEGAPGQWTNVWTHTYTINYDAYTHNFTGTGSVTGTLGGFSNTEEISGTYTGPAISFTAHYLTGPYSLDGVSTPQFDYHWYYSGPFGTQGWATSNLPGQPPLEVIVTEPVAVP